jgi:hypothetical protein
VQQEKKGLRKIFNLVYNIETVMYKRRHNNDLQYLVDDQIYYHIAEARG